MEKNYYSNAPSMLIIEEYNKNKKYERQQNSTTRMV